MMNDSNGWKNERPDQIGPVRTAVDYGEDISETKLPWMNEALKLVPVP